MLSEFCKVQWLLVLVCVRLQRLVLTTLKEQSLSCCDIRREKCGVTFGFKEQGGDNEFVSTLRSARWNWIIFETQPTFCLTSKVSMHWSILDQSYQAAIRTVWSHWIDSWARKMEASLWSQPDYTKWQSNKHCIVHTWLHCIHFLKWYSLKDLAAVCGIWRVGGLNGWTIIN